jgi:hypothetical protein
MPPVTILRTQENIVSRAGFMYKLYKVQLRLSHYKVPQ